MVECNIPSIEFGYLQMEIRTETLSHYVNKSLYECEWKGRCYFVIVTDV